MAELCWVQRWQTSARRWHQRLVMSRDKVEALPVSSPCAEHSWDTWKCHICTRWQQGAHCCFISHCNKAALISHIERAQKLWFKPEWSVCFGSILHLPSFLCTFKTPFVFYPELMKKLLEISLLTYNIHNFWVAEFYFILQGCFFPL